MIIMYWTYQNDISLRNIKLKIYAVVQKIKNFKNNFLKMLVFVYDLK